MPQFTSLTSRVLPLPINNIDTDQIIPARYLKTTEKAGLGANLFADWRYKSDGAPNPDFVLNQPRYQGAQILFAGDNFGCGSSREHAPWALIAAGFKVVISTSFADIFRNNALKNGLLPVILAGDDIKELSSVVLSDPEVELTVDLPTQTVSAPGSRLFHFPVDSFAKTCLLKGVDQLGYLLGFEKEIAAYESAHG